MTEQIDTRYEVLKFLKEKDQIQKYLTPANLTKKCTYRNCLI